MKKFIFLMMASAFLFSCSNNDDSPSNESTPKSGVTFEVSAVNNLTNGMGSRGALYSQEAVQNITNVKVYAFMSNGSGDFLYKKTYDISGWTAGTTFKRFEVVGTDDLVAGTYKFLAVGRDASDTYTVTPDPFVVDNTSYANVEAMVAANGGESEIFAGSADATITDGSRVSILMTRKVAGVLGYFKNVPQQLNNESGVNKTVRYIRLTATDANKRVNLSTGTGVSTETAAYQIFQIDMNGQTVNNGVYTGNDLSGQGVIKVDNSQLAGAFMIPVANVQFTLGLYDTDGNVVKTWSVLDGTTNVFSLQANHFYSLGIKKSTGSTDGSTPGNPGQPGDEDSPIDLLNDQNIVITVSPAWELIHNLTVQ
ncbi:FimB/Mfa2 family fimbrial subunit [uncultured Phocaeicola sp.]|uniref:FimB/Mfa2 family fimbrial subunit n=1 Tax=uncultured Phocaeicola sp. TaxID=990718 RepID=UPI0014335B1B|nr:FimB/Mfa2 family fimbrial subunit [uncultured Phocaeicola sp.]GFH98520.1 hypothetical protein IMSAGC004_00911 [Bacteroidaceae bacterium]